MRKLYRDLGRHYTRIREVFNTVVTPLRAAPHPWPYHPVGTWTARGVASRKIKIQNEAHTNLACPRVLFVLCDMMYYGDRREAKLIDIRDGNAAL